MRANVLMVVLAVAVSALVGRCDGADLELVGDLPADAGADDDVVMDDEGAASASCGCGAELAELRAVVGELLERADWTDTRIRDTAGILADGTEEVRAATDALRDQVSDLRRRVEALEAAGL
jgi:hypothetical protein